jgi:large subunit ribosomal protein L23
MTAITDVLVAPIVTEKTVAQTGKYTFKVHGDASKQEVAQAVNAFYGVEVVSVNITINPAKTRTVGRGREISKRKQLKKAIVTLKNGETINFNDFK